MGFPGPGQPDRSFRIIVFCRRGSAVRSNCQRLAALPHISQIVSVVSEFGYDYFDQKVEGFWEISRKPGKDHKKTQTFYTLVRVIRQKLRDAQASLNR